MSFESLRAFFLAVLGEYTPMTVTIDGVTTVLQGVAGVDWPYLVRALSVILVVYCILRMLGAWLLK